MLSNSTVKVYKSFRNEILLIGAIRATTSGAIDECMMTSYVRGAAAPFPRIFRNFTDEDENGEAGVQFILLEFNTSRPIIHAMVRSRRGRLVMMGWRMKTHMMNRGRRWRIMAGWCRYKTTRVGGRRIVASCFSWKTTSLGGRSCCQWYLFGRVCKSTDGSWDRLWHSRKWIGREKASIELVDYITNRGPCGRGVRRV